MPIFSHSDRAAVSCPYEFYLTLLQLPPLLPVHHSFRYLNNFSLKIDFYFLEHLRISPYILIRVKGLLYVFIRHDEFIGALAKFISKLDDLLDLLLVTALPYVLYKHERVMGPALYLFYYVISQNILLDLGLDVI